jgi:hypothetical protein
MIIAWQTCALNLRQAGMPLAQVDRRIGEWKGFAAKLANGDIQEPKFSQGLKLLDLHVALCGEEKTAALRG